MMAYDDALHPWYMYPASEKALRWERERERERIDLPERRTTDGAAGPASRVRTNANRTAILEVECVAPSRPPPDELPGERWDGIRMRCM